MTLGHVTKVTQITYLIEPCRRSLRDDRNRHWDNPIRSPDVEVMPDIAPPAWHLPQMTLHSTSLPWGLTNGPPNTWIHAQSEAKIERPHMSLQWASEVATRRLG